MSIQLEILNSSYWEHFKFSKELAGYLDLNHPKRVKIEKELNLIIKQIHKINNNYQC